MFVSTISYVYLLAIVAINFGFAHTVPIDTPLGPLPPMAFFVGVVFVLRDYVQRSIGHKVLLFMTAGCILSFFTSSPIIATASAAAFVAAAVADWGIYTIVPGAFRHKVLYSSVIGVLVDTLVFLPMIGMFSWAAVTVMYMSKMVAALLVFFWYTFKKDDTIYLKTA